MNFRGGTQLSDSGEMLKKPIRQNVERTQLPRSSQFVNHYEWFSSFHHCFPGGSVPNLPLFAPQDIAGLPSGDTSNSAQAALEDAGLGSMT